MSRSRAWSRRFVPLGLMLLPWILLAGCKQEFPQTALHPESDTARLQHDLLKIIFWWVLGIFVVVEGWLLYTVLRFRARPGQAEPEQSHGHTGVELAWTAAPALILAFIGVPTVYTIFHTQAPAPEDAMAIEVVGHQWWWEFRYPDYGIVTASDLHLPVGRPVNLKMTSQDVIHSLWVPRLFGKRDVLPGRTTYIWFRADSVGERPGQCGELCGASHANMRLTAVVQAPEDFAAWVEAQKAPPAEPADSTSLEFQGKQVYSRSLCITCHTIQGVSVGVVGPNLTHVGSRLTLAGGMYRNTHENMRRWIENPPAAKPGSLMPFQDMKGEPLEALVTYLRSLK